MSSSSITKTMSRQTSVSKSESLITFAVENSEILIKSALYENENIYLFNMKNSKQYNLLHLACYNNNLSLVQLYFNYLSNQLEKGETVKDQITRWVNQQNQEGFTPLHLASYRGNLKIIYLLEENGASYLIKNHTNISVLHTSAQGDQPLTCVNQLIFFLDRIDINQVDDNGSTPLHWAAYSSSFFAVSFLIAWGANINIQDTISGRTALHIATMEGNAKIVRKLLMKGIDRNIQNKDGQLAYDIAKENNSKQIITMIKDKYGLMQLCNVRQPFRPIKKRKTSLITFFVLYLSCFALNIIFLFPYVIDQCWMIFYFAFSILTVIFFIQAWLRDPGFVPLSENGKLFEILQNYKCEQICPDCLTMRIKRSKHCEVCQRCVRVYDHHCPWLNNCVGENNYGVFYIFIILLFIQIALDLIMQLQHIEIEQPINNYLPLSDSQLLKGKIFTLCYECLFCLIFIIPLGILISVQTKNLFMGQTTFERHMTSKREKGKENKSQQQKPSLQNCISMCFGAKKDQQKFSDNELMNQLIINNDN